MLSQLDRKIIALASKDIPLVSDPFKEMASLIGIGESELLSRLKSYRKNGIMRKFSAVVNHRKIGFKYNAMVVWNVPDKSTGKAGRKMADFPEVSHCYQRRKASCWKYNLYSMIHGSSRKECLKVVKKISEKIVCRDYRVLFSSREYKKTGVKY